jgi:hypothetical protein
MPRTLAQTRRVSMMMASGQEVEVDGKLNTKSGSVWEAE